MPIPGLKVISRSENWMQIMNRGIDRETKIKVQLHLITMQKPVTYLFQKKAFGESKWVNLGLHKVKFSNWYFRIKMCFWTSLASVFPKCRFYFCSICRTARKCSLKNDIINGHGFWAICLPKIDASTWNLAFQISRWYGSITYIPVFWKFWV